MKYYNLAKNVAVCVSKKGIITENTEEGYPETHWDEHELKEKIRDGFLVEVKPNVKKAENKKELLPNFITTTESQLKEMLTQKGIPFSDTADKKELYNLLRGK